MITIFFSIGGYFISFKLYQWHIKKMVFQAIINGKLNAPLVKIKNNSSIDWKENGKEFEFMGKMYDVVKSNTDSKGEMVYYCFDDKEENQILYLYKNLEKQNTNKNKNRMAYSFVLFSESFKSEINRMKNKSQVLLFNPHYPISEGFTNIPFLPPSA